MKKPNLLLKPQIGFDHQKNLELNKKRREARKSKINPALSNDLIFNNHFSFDTKMMDSPFIWRYSLSKANITPSLEKDQSPSQIDDFLHFRTPFFQTHKIVGLKKRMSDNILRSSENSLFKNRRPSIDPFKKLSCKRRNSQNFELSSIFGVTTNGLVQDKHSLPVDDYGNFSRRLSDDYSCNENYFSEKMEKIEKQFELKEMKNGIDIDQMEIIVDNFEIKEEQEEEEKLTTEDFEGSIQRTFSVFHKNENKILKNQKSDEVDANKFVNILI